MLPVLIIEDDDSIRETMCEALCAEGFAVKTVTDGAEALDAIRAGERPGLVLLDLMMPGVDGWHFLEQLDVDLPIVVVSAFVHGAKTMSAAALLRRPVGFMTKPVNLDTLIDVVRTYCGPPVSAGVEHAR
jgi:CheY-like chemotaxis protein